MYFRKKSVEEPGALTPTFLPLRSAMELILPEFFGATTTYAELGDQIARAAEGLRKSGVRKGDRVALVLPNCPQHVVAFYAALRLGAVVVEHNPLYTPRELRHQFVQGVQRVRVVEAEMLGRGFRAEAPAFPDLVFDVARAAEQQGAVGGAGDQHQPGPGLGEAGQVEKVAVVPVRVFGVAVADRFGRGGQDRDAPAIGAHRKTAHP